MNFKNGIAGALDSRYSFKDDNIFYAILVFSLIVFSLELRSHFSLTRLICCVPSCEKLESKARPLWKYSVGI